MLLGQPVLLPCYFMRGLGSRVKCLGAEGLCNLGRWHHSEVTSVPEDIEHCYSQPTGQGHAQAYGSWLMLSPAHCGLGGAYSWRGMGSLFCLTQPFTQPGPTLSLTA